MINPLSISNFKSIKSLETDCSRINIFIGEPNVGKSNILEALSLFTIPYILSETNKSFNSFIRYKNLKNLFYDNMPNKSIEVSTNIGSACFRFHNNLVYDLIIAPKKSDISLFNDANTTSDLESTYSELIESKENFDSEYLKLYYQIFNGNGDASGISRQRSDYYSSIRKYSFNKSTPINSGFLKYLVPPYGENLTSIIQNNSELLTEISSFFDNYKLELLFDVENNIFEIQKKVNKIIYKYPFQLLADTLQRIIFYLAVVETNSDTVILLEEPETHSYPPFTKLLAEKMSRSNNQFFISTHSPYLLNNLIENTDFSELGIYITYLEDYQTKIRKLERAEIEQILDDYIDVFFNLDKFQINAK
ncbi:MAG: AAA family ATPase [Bacteroidetes bacterium]|nr:AAA family ATPase [Bacteroidota bacterium]MBL7104572.1 AAA family ATPase [Bacteroidales bacterium]